MKIRIVKLGDVRYFTIYGPLAFVNFAVDLLRECNRDDYTDIEVRTMKLGQYQNSDTCAYRSIVRCEPATLGIQDERFLQLAVGG